jgi:hypothetical protein
MPTLLRLRARWTVAEALIERLVRHRTPEPGRGIVGSPTFYGDTRSITINRELRIKYR